MKQPSNKLAKSGYQISIEFGIIGGMLLIAAFAFFQNGYLQIVPYALILLPLGFALNHRLHRKSDFFKRFLGAWITFILMSAMFYVYIIVFGHAADSAFGVHLVRMLAILAIGAASSLLLTFLVRWINPVII